MLYSSRVRARVRVRIIFSIWLVSGYAHGFILLSVVIITPPMWAGVVALLLFRVAMAPVHNLNKICMSPSVTCLILFRLSFYTVVTLRA